MNPLLALAAATFAIGTQTYVFAGLLADMARDFGVPLGAAGQVATAFSATFALAAPLAAGLAARRERRAVLSAALLATAVCNLLAALAPGFAALIGLRIAAALAAAFVTPIASATAVLLVPPERRGKALAVVMSGLTVAFTLGIPLGSAVGGWFGWRSTFVFAALLALLAAGVVRAALPPVPAPAAARPALGPLLRAPGVRSSFALTFLGFAATFTVVAFLGPVVNVATGLSGGAVGPFQALVGLGSLAGVALGGWIADGPRERGTVAALFGAMALTLALYTPLLAGIVAPPAATVALGAVILVGAAALFALTPAIQARLARAAPAAGPVLFGLNGAMVFAGQGAGALVGGLVTEVAGFAAVGAAGAVVALLAAAVALSPAGAAMPRPLSAAAKETAT